MANRYPFSAYDKFFCLKISIPLWVAILFLARPFAILLMSVVNRRDRTGLITIFYGDPISMGIDMLAALPVMLVVYAYVKRRPEASAFVRWIWTHGRSLLLASATMNVVSVFLPFIWEPASRLQTPELAKLAIAVMIIHMLITYRRVRDTFGEFPQPVDNKTERAHSKRE